MAAPYPNTNKKEAAQKFFKNCRDNFDYFCATSLVIRDKSGHSVNMTPNRAQMYVHEQLEKQMQEVGRIRAVIVKGRQQGISTYVQARFLWRMLHQGNLKAYILTHLAESTKALFAMTRRFVDNLKVYKPELGKANVNELTFSDISCDYKVGTAGSAGVGRGETIQLFHGSEVAYWPKADEHFAGILQAVPEMDGTEIICESTANGIGNLFHRLCVEGMEGTNGFRTIFVPWYIQDEYQIHDALEIEPDQEERNLMRTLGLRIPQIKWRRAKIYQLGDVRKFRQEYPSTPTDAFILDTERAFITMSEVDGAMYPTEIVEADAMAVKIMGIDPARLGSDATGIAVRCGRILDHIETLPKMDTMQLCGAIIRLIRHHEPERVFLDMGSFGAAVYDRLREQGYNMVHGINFGQTPENPERYSNKRAEMYDRMKRWLNDKPCKIPQSDSLKAELTSFNFHENSSGKLVIEKKEDMKRRGIASPNLVDAFCLTFAESVHNNKIRYSSPSTITPQMDWNPYSL